DDIVYGGKGNDNLYTNAGNDILSGDEGDDHLDGNIGNDTYLFSRGHGNDTIVDFDTHENTDQIKLSDVASTEVSFTQDGSDLVLDGYESGDSIRVQDFFFGKDHYIEEFNFTDKQLTAEEVISQLKQKPTQPTGSKATYGTDGDDTIYTEEQDDIVYGGKGNDNLYTNAGNDILSGDEGDDHLDGNIGNDTYLFNRGHGNDTIVDFDTHENTDQIKLNDVASTEVSFTKDGSDLVLDGYESGDSIRVQDFFFGKEHQIEKIYFSDNTVLDNSYFDQYQNASNIMINAMGGIHSSQEVLNTEIGISNQQIKLSSSN
uniref:calcium-binding protein n=1 Tax=Acinetobacter sp. HY1485 TaxID=2970918 RepID=UPI002FD08D52